MACAHIADTVRRPALPARAGIVLVLAMMAMAGLSAAQNAAEPPRPVTTSQSAASEPGTSHSATSQSASTQSGSTQPATTSAPALPPSTAGNVPLGLRDSDRPMLGEGGGLGKLLGYTTLVLVLGVATMVVIRRMGPRIGRGTARQVRLLETTYVGPRKSLQIVQVGSSRYLLSNTPTGVTMLADVTSAVAVATPTEAAASDAADKGAAVSPGDSGQSFQTVLSREDEPK